MLTLLVVIVLVLALTSAAPVWPYSQGWGYYPSSGLGTVLAIVLILWFLGIIQ